MHDNLDRRLDEIAEEIATTYRAGQVVSIEDLCGRYPELAGDVRELYSTLIRLEQARPVGPNFAFERLSHAPSALLQPDAPPLGDYRIVREIGRGGMGVIYEARQESLDRRAALKVLPPWAMDDPRRVQRFEREARAEAGLHHTNIVPVLGVGTDSGLHYIVMQLIEGCALDKIIGHDTTC